ncbi:MAG: hypothetical protein AAFU85_27490, partial [Planctomycetota bacterium]
MGKSRTATLLSDLRKNPVVTTTLVHGGTRVKQAIASKNPMDWIKPRHGQQRRRRLGRSVSWIHAFVLAGLGGTYAHAQVPSYARLGPVTKDEKVDTQPPADPEPLSLPPVPTTSPLTEPPSVPIPSPKTKPHSNPPERLSATPNAPTLPRDTLRTDTAINGLIPNPIPRGAYGSYLDAY